MMKETLSYSDREIGDPYLPVSSLHLLVPPLQLFSAAMWHVLQQQHMLHYGKLEEFVSLVMEMFPELLSESQRTELTLGLQHMGPAEIRCKTDPAVETLLWEFLSRLDQLLLVPDLKQTVSWLHAAPSVLEVCVQSDSYIDQLRTLLRPRSCQQLDKNETCLSLEECKLDYMGLPPSQRVVDSTVVTNTNSQSQFITDCINCLNPTSSGQDIKAESVMDSSDCTGPEPQSSLNGCEDVEERTPRKTGYLISRTQKNVLTNMKEEEVNLHQHIEKVHTEQLSGTLGSQKRPSSTHEHPSPPKTLPIPTQSHTGTPGAQTCSQCRKSFTKFSNVKTRLRAHADERPYLCSQCGKSFAKSSHLQEHLRTHTGERPFPCSHCGKSFALLRTLKLHQLTHTGERPYSCSQCGKSFRQSSSMKRHQRTHTGERPYHCSQCGKSFLKLCTLKNHWRTHTGERPYPCSQCGKSFSHSSSLKAHQRTHTGERPYHCSQCGKSFTSSRHLQVHLRTHTGERPYHCSQCGKSFAELRTLKVHQQTHTGERPYPCSHCGKSFSHSASLKVHQRTHTGERPYHCSQCGKSFTSSPHLQVHLRTHTGERPYPCSQCGKSFSRSESLKVHQRIHTGEHPYHCSQCGKSFKSSRHLRAHLRTHTGERPYRCCQCGKSFAQLRTLKLHQQTHTGEGRTPAPSVGRASVGQVT